MAQYLTVIGFNSAVNAASFAFNNQSLSPSSAQVTQGYTAPSSGIGVPAPGTSTATTWVMITSDNLNQLNQVVKNYVNAPNFTYDTTNNTFISNTPNITPSDLTVTTSNGTPLFTNGVPNTNQIDDTITQPPVPAVPQSLQDQIIQQQLLQQQLNDQLKQYLQPDQLTPTPAIPQSLQDQITQYNLQQKQLLDQLNQYFTPSPPVDQPFPYQPIFDNPDLRKMVQPQPYQNPNDPMVVDPTQPYDPLSLPGFDPSIDPKIFQFPPGMETLPPQLLQRISEQLPEIVIRPEGQPYEQVSPPDLMPPPGFEMVPGDQFENIQPRPPVFQKPLPEPQGPPAPSDSGEGGGGASGFTQGAPIQTVTWTFNRIATDNLPVGGLSPINGNVTVIVPSAAAFPNAYASDVNFSSAFISGPADPSLTVTWANPVMPTISLPAWLTSAPAAGPGTQLDSSIGAQSFTGVFEVFGQLILNSGNIGFYATGGHIGDSGGIHAGGYNPSVSNTQDLGITRSITVSGFSATYNSSTGNPLYPTNWRVYQIHLTWNPQGGAGNVLVSVDFSF